MCGYIKFALSLCVGWWFVSYQDKEGWAPSSYLEPSTGHSSLTAEDLDEVYAQENGVVDEGEI